MKKIIKNNIFGFIIGGLIFGVIGVGAATLYNASQVSYNDGNVKDALDELYRNTSNLPDELMISGTPTWKSNAAINSNTSNYVMMQPSKLYLFDRAIDLTKYKYLVLVYNKSDYYTATLGMGVINKNDATLSECKNITTKNTISWNGNSIDKKTPQIIYLDVSDLNGNYYPFIYYSSNIYSGYLYYYLTTDETIPTI